VPVGKVPEAIAIAYLNAPFTKFTVEDLDTSEHKVNLEGKFTLGANSPGLDFDHQSLTLAVGNLNLFILPGTVKQLSDDHHFAFDGTINGLKVKLDFEAGHDGSRVFDYSIKVKGVGVDTPDPATVILKIGPNTGAATACQHHCEDDSANRN